MRRRWALSISRPCSGRRVAPTLSTRPIELPRRSSVAAALSRFAPALPAPNTPALPRRISQDAAAAATISLPGWRR